MTDPAHSPNPLPDLDALLQSLRRKEGSWVEWGKACQQLQKSGYNPQAIFEATGFEPIVQNQIIVGMQVYEGLVKAAARDDVLAHFQRKGSDILYEFRTLTQAERPAAAELVIDKNLDLDEAHDLAKALKNYAQLREQPTGFSSHPGDVVAYQAWRVARQTADLQERSRLIARALKFAVSGEARTQVERLLTDFTVMPRRQAPRLSVYRLESVSELPRVLPVVGQMPLTRSDLQAVPFVEGSGGFGLISAVGTGVWVGIPGWQVIVNATDPMGILCESDYLSTVQESPFPAQEVVLLIVDRADRTWQPDSYFLTASEEQQLQVSWFESDPAETLLGRILIVVRPPKLWDEMVAKDPWQMDE